MARTLAAVFYKISTGVAALQPLLMLMLMLLMLPHRALLVGDELSLHSGCCDMLHARARTAGIGASCRRRSCEAGNDSKYGHLSRVTCDVYRVLRDRCSVGEVVDWTQAVNVQ